MKQKNLTWLLAVGLLVSQIPSLTFNIKPASARLTTFDCQQMGADKYGTMYTLYDDSGQQIASGGPIITWEKDAFSESGYTPGVRCTEVSRKLSNVVRSNGGSLSNLWLTSGMVSGMPVICHVSNTGRGCDSNNLLFTLCSKREMRENKCGNRDRNEALRRLLNYSIQGSGLPVEQTAGTDYVSLERLVQAANGNNTSSPRTPEPRPISPQQPRVPTRPQPPQPSTGSGGGSI